MNAVNLQPNTYRSVEITVHDNLKNDLTDFLSLKGILKDSSTSQSDRDLIDDYLKEKYDL